MYPPNNRTKGLPVLNPLPLRSLSPATILKAEMGSALSQVEADVNNTKNYMDVLQKLGLTIKRHEDNIKFLTTQKNILEDSILDIEVAIGRYHTSTESMTEKEDTPIVEGTYEPSNGLICQLKARLESPVSHNPLVKDVLGIVATLGSVDDENLSRLLAEYLGRKAMLAVVCKTLDGVKSMESYGKEGVINRNSGLNGIGASIGRTLKGRFRVICLDDLRPYGGEFVADDPQKRLDLLKPKLPGGEIPLGFVGYAVNLVHIDNQNLFCLTTSGHGLRETLFYNLFSHLQVYRTREDMQQALPFINDGAVSLDGGIIRSPGVLYLGDRKVQVKFSRISGKSSLPENYCEIENILKIKKWDQERLLDDMRREQSFLGQAKSNFEIKKKEFVNFLAQSSQHAPAQYAPAQMGGQPTHETPVEWSEECEMYFLEILADIVRLEILPDLVRRDHNAALIFKGNDWVVIDDIIFRKFGMRYGPDKLNGKYHQMRSTLINFNELISNTGVTWNSATNTVSASEAVWDAFFKRDKIFKTFKNKGCKNYSLLNLVFSNSTASGVFRNASSSARQTFGEEQIIEHGRDMGKSEGVGGDSGRSEGCKRDGKGKRISDMESDYVLGNRRIKKKNSGSDKSVINARKERI